MVERQFSKLKVAGSIPVSRSRMTSSDDIQNPHDIALPEGNEQSKIESPEESGEAAVSGSEAGVETDDNVDTMAESVGLYDKEGKTEEVGIAEQIERDEKAKQDIPPDK